MYPLFFSIAFENLFLLIQYYVLSETLFGIVLLQEKWFIFSLKFTLHWPRVFCPSCAEYRDLPSIIYSLGVKKRPSFCYLFVIEKRDEPDASFVRRSRIIFRDLYDESRALARQFLGVPSICDNILLSVFFLRFRSSDAEQTRCNWIIIIRRARGTSNRCRDALNVRCAKFSSTLFENYLFHFFSPWAHESGNFFCIHIIYTPRKQHRENKK